MSFQKEKTMCSPAIDIDITCYRLSLLWIYHIRLTNRNTRPSDKYRPFALYHQCLYWRDLPISSSFSRSILDTLVLADLMSASLSFNSLNSAMASFLALCASFNSFCCEAIFSLASWRTCISNTFGFNKKPSRLWTSLKHTLKQSRSYGNARLLSSAHWASVENLGKNYFNSNNCKGRYFTL